LQQLDFASLAGQIKKDGLPTGQPVFLLSKVLAVPQVGLSRHVHAPLHCLPNSVPVARQLKLTISGRRSFLQGKNW
jgi:hypothetical protein